jgi:hypothetical protein
MKKLALILGLICFVQTVFGQFPQTQTLGSPTTLVKARGALVADSGLVNGKFVDTTAANRSHISFYAGAQIFTTSDNTTWVRNVSATRWLFSSNGGGGSSFCYGRLYGLDVTWSNLLTFDMSAGAFCIGGVT